MLHALASGATYGRSSTRPACRAAGYPASRTGATLPCAPAGAAARREKRPPRRYYRLTAPGVRVLNVAIQQYRALKPLPALAGGKARG
jgi:hypothetical protein